ncbi:glucokinase [Pseudoxanthomonas sp. JBR18]|uniref:glucokinase n=1 Tax=Pseudoxanthomonas sp. JBR18 TaxID=2969308 RepID=UPI0023050609|nr:glucokinase [Pseudoxanthomonas sp. JBR18]WCE05387.1 glucokinase [Pseudoxanthomonas sp. JBR18]
MSARHPIHAAAMARGECFLSADVGGTHARIGLIQPSPANGQLQVLAYSKYRCADHSGLDEILALFLHEAGRPRVHRGVIASAGHALDDGRLIASNLPWPLIPEQMRHNLALQSLHLVNDFEAVAYATPRMPASEVLHLCGPRNAQKDGPALVIGPGTGLGAAVCIPSAQGEVVLATEAGQATLAAITDTEQAVVRELRRQHAHVSIERVISGPGLLTLYRTLCTLHAATARCQTPSDVTTAALDHSDPLAHEALSVFAGLLGSVLGDMALMYGIHRGIYLAGGFLPQIGAFIAASTFQERLLDRGGMRPALEAIPVKVIEHGQLGVLGAATWLLRHHGAHH